jgi:hypothetical protein
MDEVNNEVSSMNEEQIRAALAKFKEQADLRKAKQTERNKNLTPEQKAERSARAEAYRLKNPDKFKAQREAYNKKPEVIEKRKAYMKNRNAKQKAILAKAKELGIIS